MSLATPQSVTINAVATDLDRIYTEKTSSVYASADGAISLKVSHQSNKNRVRRMIRLDQTLVAADVLTSENQYQKAGVYLVIDEPIVGFTDVQLDYLVDALAAWLTPSNIGAVLASRH